MLHSGGNPGDMIHYEGIGANTRLDISVATDMHLQAGNNITLEAKTINLTATDQIQFLSEQGSVGTQAQVNSTEKAVTGQIAGEAEKNVSLNAVSGGIVITGKAGIAAQTPADVNVKGGTVHLNGG